MHEMTVEYLRWIPLLPLLGAAFNGILNRRLPKAVVTLVAVGTVAASFALALKAFFQLKGLPEMERLLHDPVYSWIPIGDLQVDLSLMVDPLSAVMILLVTGVGLLIHIYSIGYMNGDGGYQRFFVYMNLFMFAMLLLVTGDNLLVLFVGWEGVGLCSYLLIGFWFQDMANSVAGKKAFVVNRIGDFGFLLGMFVLVKAMAGHVDPGVNLLSFRALAAHTDLLAPVATLAGLLLFVGATGKSAQIPLYVWLPDAMAGPTPVSALIHAATMVTAGVYMVARMNFLYVLSPTAMGVIAAIGVATALLAATIAIAQSDIKKVLAYSTVSQLGYMFLACGVGAFGVGIFHVLTHGFFKALLFLGAGSVIHAMHHEQDMRRMGGLRKHTPITFGTMLVGTLAIAGIFPFAGFFSKDEILYNAWLDNRVLWVIGYAVAGLTAFYMARLVALTFFGKSRVPEHTAKHLHESPAVMTLPLVVLAGLSFVGGWIGWPEFLGGNNWLHHWFAPVFGGGHGAAEAVEHAAEGAAGHGEAVAHGVAETGHEVVEAAGHVVHSATTEWILAGLSLGLAAIMLFAGLRLFSRRKVRSIEEGEDTRPLPTLLRNKYYVDEIYEGTFIRPGFWLSDSVLWRVVDALIIDGLLVNGLGRLLSLVGQVVRLLQNGLLRWYAYSFAAGVLVILVYLARRIG